MVLELSSRSLKSAGLSRQKVSYLKNIAKKLRDFLLSEIFIILLIILKVSFFIGHFYCLLIFFLFEYWFIIKS